MSLKMCVISKDTLPRNEAYFQLSFDSMQRIRESTLFLNIWDESDISFPQRPGVEHFRYSQIDQWRRYDIPLTSDGLEYHIACLKLQRQESQDPNKLLYQKFKGNDGWIVTPRECRILTAAIYVTRFSHGDEHWLAIMPKFMHFCDRAARHYGFQIWSRHSEFPRLPCCFNEEDTENRQLLSAESDNSPLQIPGGPFYD